MIKLTNVKYKNILDIDELTIPKNKITCILGQSGSGKTTLLRLLNKLISCDSGELYYNNKNYNDIDSVELRREVVMLSQNPSIFNGTIKDNLLIGLKFSEKPLALDDELNKILDIVQLNKTLEDDAERLSGGEKQRLALGRVLLMEPEVFLLDEPSSALDENTEKLIIERLVSISKRNNKTLIMVTHSKNMANLFSDNIIKMSNGKLVSREDKNE